MFQYFQNKIDPLRHGSSSVYIGTYLIQTFNSKPNFFLIFTFQEEYLLQRIISIKMKADAMVWKGVAFSQKSINIHRKLSWKVHFMGIAKTG